MATNTTNFGLKKPAYSDTADIADINGNMDKVDVSLNGLADAIAIVANNNTHAAITAGQYVYVHGHGTLAEGLYKANSNIAANATLTSSNLTADSSGGLNALNSNILVLKNMAKTVSQADYNDITELTYSTGVGTNMPSANGYHLVIPLNGNGSVLGQIAIDCYTSSTKWYYRSRTASTWRAWAEITDATPVTGAVTPSSNINNPVFNAIRSGKTCVISYYFVANQAISRNTIIATLPTGFAGYGATQQWNSETTGTKRIKVSGGDIFADQDIANGTVCQGQISYISA